MPLASGTKLGPYEITAALGAGGMGEVYRARDSRLGRDVAIKVLPTHVTPDPESRQRFEREARAISQLNHPNICTLHDVGRHDGMDYLVMELLEGESLAARLERGPLATDELLRTAIQIVEGLDKAHRQGLIHRDLKPGNVMLTKTGAKLLDFGLARAAGLGPASDLSRSPTLTRPLTTEGSIVGTFQYMSPEQLEGGEADARSDIFAFGAVLYEMATGRRAFEGKSQASLIGSIMKEEPAPVSVIQPMLPPALDRIVRTCLAKDPEDRYQSAHDLKLQLQWVAEAGSQAGVPAPVAARRRGRERATLIVAIVASLAAVTLGAAYVLRPAPSRPVVRFQIPPPAAVQFMDAPRISPDGSMLAYNATDSTGATSLWVRPLAAMTAHALQGTEGAGRPFWSPDSRFLAFFAGGKLKKVEVTGAPPTVICDAATGSDGAWSRDGVILFDGRGKDPIRRVPASGGVATDEVAPDSTIGALQVGWPEFLPDGRHFLYLALGSQPTLKVRKLGAKDEKALGPSESRIQYADPGYLVFSRSGTLVAQRFDTGALKFVGEPVPIAEQVTTDPVGAADFSVSRSGVLSFSTRRAQAGQLVKLGRSGRVLGPVTAPAGVLHPWLSPDGRRIVVRILDPQTRTRDLWIVDLTRGVTSRFTLESGNENWPVWSPDGRWIAYYGLSDTGGGIFVKNASGAGQREQILPSKDQARPCDWTRDGLIFYEHDSPQTGTDVWAVAFKGDHKPQPILTGTFDQFQATLSPDGKWLAYTSNESGRSEIYVESFPDRNGKWQISNRGGQDARWRHDGRGLFYLSTDLQMTEVAIRTQPSFEAGTPQVLFPVSVLFPTGARNHYDVTADSETFYVVAPLGSSSLPMTNVVLNWTQDLTKR